MAASKVAEARRILAKPRTDRNGHPMMQMEVVILTNEQTDPEDDGRRMLYVRGNMRRAIRAAVIAASADDLRNGAQLAVMYTGQGKAIGSYAAPKLYKAKYEPPTEASLAEVAAFFDQDGDE
ncbi:hypothetical protein IU485_21145 [Nocardia cyriacigeorgica]|uniref:hypothetical protein n=1 Tax=Nocardia cyriacigeorgica TaxID=135487 RepID=UPI0018936D8F|nr:hypothetical protein [Nocardia cyriacigeorgica]MBF6083879.1 hypothetical protein [Nocardia cyriacigeorgica]